MLIDRYLVSLLEILSSFNEHENGITVIKMLLRTKGIHRVGDSEYEESEETKT